MQPKKDKFSEIDNAIKEMQKKLSPVIKKKESAHELRNLISDFIGIILFSLFLGYHIDKYTHREPIFLLISCTFGIISGIYLIYKKTQLRK